MKDKKLNTNKLQINKLWYLFVFFLLLIIIIFLCYRSLADYPVGNITISEFIKNRNINEEIILPDRGTIYDNNGNVLAQDVSSYTLIAYLSETRSTEDNIRHVVDKETTAKELSKLIDMTYEKIMERLNKDAYQVEFGTAGKNLSQIEMETIAQLNLPGIGFSKSTKRYYPNSDFASYLLGYTVNKEDDDGNIWMTGELGIEGYYDNELRGTAGYITYEKDAQGNKIANSNEYYEDAENGADVTLTIDNNIQLFVENAVKNAQQKSKSEWVVMAIMHAKTGAILGYSSTPSFDPNIRNLTNYMDPLISYAYEPGSTMKIFSYMCAIESGNYDGEATFTSGKKTYTSETDKNDQVTIKDWNGKGWGIINYDYGFAMSSNIGVANLLEEVITKNELKDCYEKYGFGQPTGITLNQELKGDVTFKYDVEAATAGYGQGIMTTPIQILQGLTAIANDGTMLKPYVVSKITSSTGKVLAEYQKETVATIASTETIEKLKSLLRSVVCKDAEKCTGSAYYLKDYDLVGKTGTASIYDYNKGKYLTGASDYIYSFGGLYPGDDPEIIVYMAIKKPKDTKNYVAPAVKDVIINTSKYLAIDDIKNQLNEYVVEDYSNKVVTTVKNKLVANDLEVTVLGTGNKIINQYPEQGTTVYNNDHIYLLTNNYNKEAINFENMSYKEAKSILKLMNVEYELEGNGYVYEQSISPGNIINDKIILKLKKKY